MPLNEKFLWLLCIARTNRELKNGKKILITETDEKIYVSVRFLTAASKMNKSACTCK